MPTPQDCLWDDAMISNTLYGAGLVLEGLRLLAGPGLRPYLVLPIAIGSLALSIVFTLGATLGKSLLHWLGPELDSGLPMFDWLWHWLWWPSLAIGLVGLTAYVAALAALLIGAPFNVLLADKVEYALTDKRETRAKRIVLPRTARIAWRDQCKRVAIASVWLLPAWLLSLLIPVAGVVAWLALASWNLGLQYVRQQMRHEGSAIREVRARLRRHRAMTFGFGATTFALTLTPILNLVAMPAAVVGATLMWLREFKTINYQDPNKSRIATRAVLVTIDHLSGRIEGEMLTGPMRGLALDCIETEVLTGLLTSFQTTDVPSADALEIYLTRQRGYERPEMTSGRGYDATRLAADRMDDAEARAVLGIGVAASLEEVRNAHKRLIHRVHPDRGGSDYLASIVNRAKDVLHTDLSYAGDR